MVLFLVKKTIFVGLVKVREQNIFFRHRLHLSNPSTSTNIRKSMKDKLKKRSILSWSMKL